MKSFFHLKENGTTVSTEIFAGISTFFAMAYIIIVCPEILSETGMEWSAVFLATILTTAFGTLFVGLFANVPFAVAPALGLISFFTYILCYSMNLPWQQALSVVFISGIINTVITVTSLRKKIIKAIPNTIKVSIGGGIGLFIAYIGLLNAGVITFIEGAPALVPFNTPGTLVFLIGLAVILVLMLLKIKGAVIIGILVASIAGIPLGLTTLSESVNAVEAFASLPSTFGVIFTPAGIPALFANPASLLIIVAAIFSLTMSDFFDSVGTFIGVGKSTKLFSDDDLNRMETSHGFATRLDKALLADSVTTIAGSILGTSNSATYAESSVGVECGGKTGLTSVVTAFCFVGCMLLSAVVSMIPAQAAAPALVAVGIMMISSFADIDWKDTAEAIPAFFTGIFMALCYSITYGIAAGCICYAVVKICRSRVKDLSPVFVVITLLFLLNFIFAAFV